MKKTHRRAVFPSGKPLVSNGTPDSFEMCRLHLLLETEAPGRNIFDPFVVLLVGDTTEHLQNAVDNGQNGGEQNAHKEHSTQCGGALRGVCHIACGTQQHGADKRAKGAAKRQECAEKGIDKAGLVDAVLIDAIVNGGRHHHVGEYVVHPLKQTAEGIQNKHRTKVHGLLSRFHGRHRDPEIEDGIHHAVENSHDDKGAVGILEEFDQPGYQHSAQHGQPAGEKQADGRHLGHLEVVFKEIDGHGVANGLQYVQDDCAGGDDDGGPVLEEVLQFVPNRQRFLFIFVCQQMLTVGSIIIQLILAGVPRVEQDGDLRRKREYDCRQQKAAGHIVGWSGQQIDKRQVGDGNQENGYVFKKTFPTGYRGALFGVLGHIDDLAVLGDVAQGGADRAVAAVCDRTPHDGEGSACGREKGKHQNQINQLGQERDQAPEAVFSDFGVEPVDKVADHNIGEHIKRAGEHDDGAGQGGFQPDDVCIEVQQIIAEDIERQHTGKDRGDTVPKLVPKRKFCAGVPRYGVILCFAFHK